MNLRLTTRLLQLALLHVACAAFLLLAGSAGWVYTRGAELDLVRWLPLIAIGNTFVVAAIGAGPNRGSWVRRLLYGVVVIGLAALAWYLTAFVVRSLFHWPTTFAAVAGQLGSFVAMLILSIKQLGDGEASAARDQALAEVRDRLARLEGTRPRGAKRRKKRR